MHVRLLLLLGLLVVVPGLTSALEYPAGFGEEVIHDNIPWPTDLELLADGRMVVAERNGNVSVIAGNTSTRVLSLPVAFEDIEEGLLGLTVHPGFPTEPYLFVYYVELIEGAFYNWTHVTRFTISNTSSFTVDDSSAIDLLSFQDREMMNTGGGLEFGPDGMLYVGTGDDNQQCEPQQFNSLKGKILRLDVSAPIEDDLSSVDPGDNPWAQASDPEGRLVFAMGLRNPFRIHVTDSGEVLFSDVGEDSWEEVNRASGGENFGWPYREGPDPWRTTPCTVHSTIPTDLVEPAFYYPDQGWAASTGVIQYTGELYPEPYADSIWVSNYLTGPVHVLDQDWEPMEETWGPGDNFIVDFEQSDSGHIYYAYHPDPFAGDEMGSIRMITYEQAPDTADEEETGFQSWFTWLGAAGLVLLVLLAVVVLRRSRDDRERSEE